MGPVRQFVRNRASITPALLNRRMPSAIRRRADLLSYLRRMGVVAAGEETELIGMAAAVSKGVDEVLELAE